MPKTDSMNFIFNRVYSAYFKTIRKIINAAVPISKEQSQISREEINRIISDQAFKVSHREIIDKLKEPWYLFIADDKNNCITHLRNVTRPQTTLEKQWLYTISKDNRSRLFNLNLDENKKIKALYEPEMWVMYDKFQNGDDYSNPLYRQNFQILLRAINEGFYISFHYFSNNTSLSAMVEQVIPLKLEYSPKNDKFRLLAVTNGSFGIYNLNNIQDLCQYQDKIPQELLQRAKNIIPETKTAIIEITDERNALQRALLSFSDYEKSITYIKKIHDFEVYRMELKYLPDNEKELVIRLLSMGHLVKVIESPQLAQQIRERIQKQANLFRELHNKK